MRVINLLINLFSIIKTKALECVSVVNQKSIPRPKILDVNEDVGEALFYPYNVLVNKCSGSCDMLNNHMAKMCVPNIIKRINMKVYIFLMRLNESICECQCDIWCQSGQYLDHKNCICKNKLIGRVIEECTSIINETMINNKDNMDDNNTVWNIFIGLISVVIFIGVVSFCVLIYFKWFKGKKLCKNKHTDY